MCNEIFFKVYLCQIDYFVIFIYFVNLNKYINDTRKEYTNFQAVIIPNLTEENYFVLNIYQCNFVFFLKKKLTISFL